MRHLNNKGIGLLEVLISIIILAVGLLMTLPLIITSIDANTISKDNTVASNLIKQTIENYENLTTLPTIPNQIIETDILDKFTRTTTLSDDTVDPSMPAGVYKVDVEVNWVDFQNVSRTTAYTTYILK
ncbi:MAG: type II secretion system protein [Candidatus Zixiibacteriota bacterium]